MRVNLISQTFGPRSPAAGTLPISLTIKPSCGLPGDYRYSTDLTTLVRMLHKKTDLPQSVIERFEGELQTQSSARILGVELSDRVLTDIGYYVD